MLKTPDASLPSRLELWGHLRDVEQLPDEAFGFLADDGLATMRAPSKGSDTREQRGSLEFRHTQPVVRSVD